LPKFLVPRRVARFENERPDQTPGELATMHEIKPFPFDLLPLLRDRDVLNLPDGTAIGRFLRTDLSSVFQPLIESGSGRCAGHEAFVRAHGGGERDIAPWNLFSLVANDEALVALDRLCRVVHVLNFLRVPDVPGKLFLNVQGRLLAAVRENHGHTFRTALDRLEFDPARIVIETPEAANLDRKLLALVLSNYRLKGFRVAANVLGLADLESLLRMVRPDFVKIDARQVRTPEAMRRVVAMTGDSGTRPIFTRIESVEQLSFLRTLPEVLLQGRAVAPPTTLPGALIEHRLTQ
jgi:EAL domain-containing protein (putative c-di-GMP-specific phosphodiesterase class I)